MKREFYTSLLILSICVLNTGCAGGLLVGEGVVAEGLAADAASGALIRATATAAARTGGLMVAERGVGASAAAITELAAGRIFQTSELQLLNVLAQARRVGRIGLSAPIVEEHCLMRCGSHLALLYDKLPSGSSKALRLLNPNGNLLANVTREGSKVIIRDPNGGVISSSFKAADRILHYADSENKVLYGYTVLDGRKGKMIHYLMDAIEKGVEMGTDAILDNVNFDDLPADFKLTKQLLRQLESKYPKELFPQALQDEEERLNQPLMIKPKSPRNKIFTAQRGSVETRGLRLELTGFVINQRYEATATIKITNVDRNVHRLALNAVGEMGFNAPPYIYAKLEDSSGLTLKCTNASGIYWQAMLVGMDDAQHFIAMQRSRYEPDFVERWLSSMSKIEPNSDQLITLKFGLPESSGSKPDLDLHFNLGIKLYDVVGERQRVSVAEMFDAKFLDVVPAH